MIHFLNFNIASPTDTELGLLNDAEPRKTSTPCSMSSETASRILILARMRRIRSMTSLKLAATLLGQFPANSSEFFIPATIRDDRMFDFDGTQPVTKDTPPVRFFSIMATLAPSSAIIEAAVNATL